MRFSGGATLALGLLFCSRVARADDALADARAEYDLGASAYDQKSFKEALPHFVKADDLAPSPQVLELAIATAISADDPVIGMQLVERAEARGMTEAARRGHGTLDTKVGRLAVQCGGPTDCEGLVDGSPVETGKPAYFKVGFHVVDITFRGAREHLSVEVRGGSLINVTPSRVLEVVRGIDSAPPPATEPSSRKGLPPAVFFAALGVTTVLGGVTVASGIDTSNLHSDFQTHREDAGLSDRGASAETRTNVLLGVTLAAAVTTAVLGIFATDWNGGAKPAERRAAAAEWKVPWRPRAL